MAWFHQIIHFIDFEGGPSSGILEYGVVTLREGELSVAHTRLCGAIGRIRPEDESVHGLSPRAVRGLAPFAEDFNFFAGLRATGTLAAHFAGAEHSLLRAVWPYPHAVPDFTRPGQTLAEWGPWLDTGRLYPALLGTTDSARLADLVAEHGLQAELAQRATAWCPHDRCHYHAALYDAIAGALLLSHLARQSALTRHSLAWMLEQSTRNDYKREILRQEEWF